MKKIVLLIVATGLLWGCGKAPVGPPAEGEADTLHTEAVARAIESSEDFAKPFLLEVWNGKGGPTVAHLVGSGYVTEGQSSLVLTEKATTIGAHATFFQSDVPVYRFPVGRRELVEIDSVVDFSATGTVKQVNFRYRRMATELGRGLVEAGSGAPELSQVRSSRELPGRAIVANESGSWRVVSLELPAGWG